LGDVRRSENFVVLSENLRYLVPRNRYFGSIGLDE